MNAQNAPVCGSHSWGPMNKGSIVVAVLKRSDRLEPRYKLSTLLLLFTTVMKMHSNVFYFISAFDGVYKPFQP